MDYTVLARRFRPQAFAEVVGQQNVAQALRNAIAAGRVAHAYLFTGARGVGKTSMARILAKSLNCPQAQNGDPCNVCDICQSITAGSDVDVLEIDGASNRGIEDIRALRANVHVKPMRSRYKIYIIDEVHMLTREAFNALLKTLEEPPPNVKFVFCTTEPQKVPDTILSRCQRFDFGTIATFAIRERLSQIAAAEGVEIEPAAVELVARRANGSMRDSQSLFDQLLAFGGKRIGVADVHRLLGTAPDERLMELADALIAGDRPGLLARFQAALESGVQLTELADQLLNYHRDLMVLAAGAREAELLSVSSEQRGVMQHQAQQWGLATILAALQILAEAKSRMRGVTYGQVLVELALVRISMLNQLADLSVLVQQLRAGGAGIAAGRTGEPARNAPPPLLRPGTVPEKKNDLKDEGRRGEVGAAASPPLVDAPREVNVSQGARLSPPESSVGEESTSGPPLPFVPGNEKEIWAQLLSQLPSMAQSQAKMVLNVAIFGPNQLVLTFGRSYHTATLERLFPLARMEQIASRLLDRPVRITCVVDETQMQEKSSVEAAPTGSAAERVPFEGEADPFVQQVKAVFNASIIR